MVLLSPSIRGLMSMLQVWESYNVIHGLKYNVTKSQLVIFKASTKCYSIVPDVTLNGARLNMVTRFKYLDHWVTDDLCDNGDIERERRSLAVPANMLARRFARCTKQVKITLFEAYCQSFYTCSLWVDYTRGTYNGLRVQYNNAFRVLLGLSRFCTASGMFAEAHSNGFAAIIRKRCASMLHRLRDSPNRILSALSAGWDSPMLAHWMRQHAVVQKLNVVLFLCRRPYVWYNKLTLRA
ncbi:uncharacterized protein LOC113227298 [Hyposmocoma kahamanoa]|uniref:uncharacterized protein LOC113227298 n=1 Tax=Hyposmocoma kahamanoa TaxID=1477025 RepID=UPI000E6D9769|nr:uncharacterized protein LOC113227298 [Hyposmocoma kahamanoa]